jgi:hypothetical protein
MDPCFIVITQPVPLSPLHIIHEAIPSANLTDKRQRKQSKIISMRSKGIPLKRDDTISVSAESKSPLCLQEQGNNPQVSSCTTVQIPINQLHGSSPDGPYLGYPADELNMIFSQYVKDYFSNGVSQTVLS